MIDSYSATRRSSSRDDARICLACVAIFLAATPATLLADPPSILNSFFNRPSAAVVTEVPHPSVARITSIEGNVQSLGSGTLIDVRDRYGLVITNWHVIRDAKGEVLVTFPNGFQSKAQILQVDQDWDLAALVIWRPELPPVPLTTAAPQPGDRLIIAGYGSGKYRAVQGRCTQYVSPSPRLPHEMIELAAEARQGDSGGPIFNERGELAGVLFGAGGGTTAGSWAGRVRLFLGPLGASLGQASLPTSGINPADALAANTLAANAAPSLDLNANSNPQSGAFTATAPPTAATVRDEQNEGRTDNQTNSTPSSMALASLPRPSSTFSSAFSSDIESGVESAVSGSDLMPVPATTAPEVREEQALPTPSLVGSTTESFSDRRRVHEKAAERTGAWNLDAIVGTTVFDQAKTALALVGLLAFLFQLSRISRSND